MPTKQQQENWLNTAVGRGMNPDGEFGYQCVDVPDDYAIALFGNWVNTIRPVNGAVDIFDNANPDVFIKVLNNPNDANQIPPRGAIVVYKGWPGNPLGHTNVVVSSTTANFTAIEQDGDTVRYDYKGNVINNGSPAYSIMRGYGWHEILGWLIPKLQPEPKPVPPPVPVVPKPVVVANPFVRLSSPMNLITNKQPTDVFDLTTLPQTNKTIVTSFDNNTDFIAIGKYTDPTTKTVYFMTDYSFGKADTTSKPDHYFGINTIDLSPKPIVKVNDTTAPIEVAPTLPAPDDTSVSIPVKVIPPDPNKWMLSFTPKMADYIATESAVVHDINGVLPDLQLTRGQVVHIGGTFERNGVTYYRTQKSIIDCAWYGIPLKYNSIDTLTEDDAAFDVTPDIKTIVDNLSPRQYIIKAVASLTGIISRFIKKIKGEK